MQQTTLTKNQSRWQSLRTFNIVIVSSLIFFFTIGMGQSYIFSDSSPTFTTPIYIPLIILLLCTATLLSLIYKKDTFTQPITLITCISITLFVSINSYFQEQIYLHSFLYLVLLLPLFYSYLFAYSNVLLMVNIIFLAICYILASIIGKTDALVLLFNSTFLITICYLTVSNQLLNSKASNNPIEKKIEKTAILNQKSSHYLNRIIHDIRQPLSSLSLYGHLLENKLSGTAHAQLSKNIKLASEELERWLSSLLDLARLDGDVVTPSISEFTLASALSSTLKKYQFQASVLGIRLTSRLSDLTAKTDKRLLTEIVETLINNAIVHGSQEKKATILLSARHYQNKVLLQVWNQGQQIKPSLFENLFDEIALADNPLHNKTKGIGLGLAIAQRKARLCNTEIEVVSNPHGSRFSMLLEMATSTAKDIDLNKLSNLSANYKILLIDDDQGILSALTMLLENWGYVVDCANTAEAGLQKYHSTNYDLVISDYRLPNQKTGLDIIKEIRKQGNIPAVLLTGEADPGKLKEVQETNKDINYKILNKPVKPASLRLLLKQLLQ
tara:strand:- start:3496 stop:5163 length:1668 start_codon:yes stop_codon:yes gene_type:complete